MKTNGLPTGNEIFLRRLFPIPSQRSLKEQYRVHQKELYKFYFEWNLLINMLILRCLGHPVQLHWK